MRSKSVGHLVRSCANASRLCIHPYPQLLGPTGICDTLAVEGISALIYVVPVHRLLDLVWTLFLHSITCDAFWASFSVSSFKSYFPTNSAGFVHRFPFPMFFVHRVVTPRGSLLFRSSAHLSHDERGLSLWTNKNIGILSMFCIHLIHIVLVGNRERLMQYFCCYIFSTCL